VTISYRLAMTGAECDFGSSTRPSTTASAKTEIGNRAKTTLNKTSQRQRIPSQSNSRGVRRKARTTGAERVARSSRRKKLSIDDRFRYQLRHVLRARVRKIDNLMSATRARRDNNVRMFLVDLVEQICGDLQ